MNNEQAKVGTNFGILHSLFCCS